MSQAYDEIGQGRGVIDLGGMEVWLHKGAMMGANATRATAGGAPTVARKGGGGSMSMQEQRKALVHAWERTSGAPPRLATLSYPMRRARLREQLRDVRLQARSLGRGAVQAVKDQIVDLKAKEPGLLEWIAARQLPLRVFSSAQLSDRPLTARPSDWVRSNIGLAGVCEPCALLASPRGRLLVPKLACGGVTVAVVSDPAPSPPFFLPS